MNAKKILSNYKQIKAKYPDVLLLFRSANHYIALNDDAKTVAQICGTQLTNTLTRFEYYKLDDYLPKLVRSGHRTAVCEELQNQTKMTKEEFQELAETEGFDKAMSRLSENVETLHDEDLLIMFVKDKLDSVDYPLAAHVLNGIIDSEGDSRWYDYDFSCGTLDKPVCINTVEEALTFDYFD